MKTSLKIIGSFAISSLIWAMLFGSVSVAVTLMTLLAIHEMGHYLAAKYKHIDVSLPLFTPFGAFINMRQFPTNAYDEAFMALAGPAFGIIASFASLGLGYAMHVPALEQAGFMSLGLNLFNLIPLSPLDGGRVSMGITRYMWPLGLVMFVALFMFAGFNLYNLFVFGYIGYFSMLDIRFRNYQASTNPGYFKMPFVKRFVITDCYVALILLGIAGLLPVLPMLIK